MTKKYAIAFWLLPVKPAEAFFSGFIREFAQRFAAPIFEPHVTICVVPRPRRPITEVAAKIPLPEIELTTSGTKSGNTFTKSFFVHFARDAALQKLADTILEGFEVTAPAPVDPHLSLLYATISEEKNVILRPRLNCRRAFASTDSAQWNARCRLRMQPMSAPGKS